MPKRTTKQCRLEVEMERKPLTVSQKRRLLKVALSRAPAELKEWHQATDDTERFYAAPGAAMAAYTLGNYSIARSVALAALALAPSYKDDWNYGNVIHYAHATLGLLEVRQGNPQAAAEHLLLSGATPGSPQLNSFGPSMRLAKELLDCGEPGPVMTYFQQCRMFWSSGQNWLSIWEKKVARGATPVFFMHLYR